MMKLLRALVIGGALTLASTLAVAQDEASPDDDPTGRAATFQAVSGAQGEDVPGGPLMVAAYGVILVLLIGYVASLAMRQSQTDAQLARIAKAVEAKSGAGDTEKKA